MRSALLLRFLHARQMQCVLVVSPELHEAHVGRLAQFRNRLDAREKPTEQMLSHVILL